MAGSGDKQTPAKLCRVEINEAAVAFDPPTGCEVVTEAVHCLLLGVRPDSGPDRYSAADMLAVLAGDSDRAAAEITAEADAAGLQASRRTGAAASVRYLEGKREFLHYDQALNAGWPIATGVIDDYLEFPRSTTSFPQVGLSRTRPPRKGQKRSDEG